MGLKINFHKGEGMMAYGSKNTFSTTKVSKWLLADLMSLVLTFKVQKGLKFVFSYTIPLFLFHVSGFLHKGLYIMRIDLVSLSMGQLSK